jgi:hypothetical protein
MRRLALIAALVLAAPAALAGDHQKLAGCDCQNMCPLAQTANEHRSTGGEAVLASATVRAEVAKTIAKNLASI